MFPILLLFNYQIIYSLYSLAFRLCLILFSLSFLSKKGLFVDLDIGPKVVVYKTSGEYTMFLSKLDVLLISRIIELNFPF